MKRNELPDWVDVLRHEGEMAFMAGPCGQAPRTDHGPAHWARVWNNGMAICAHTPEADATVVGMFALLHDTQRENEWHDPQHGDRAAEFAARLYKQGQLPIDGWQLYKLCFAMRLHDKGLTTEDATIGACWDADRLDLPRVGKQPDARYLSTTFAKLLLVGKA